MNTTNRKGPPPGQVNIKALQMVDREEQLQDMQSIQATVFNV